MNIKDKIFKKMSSKSKKTVKMFEAMNIPYFFTGSRCWGVSTPESDFDICIHLSNTNNVLSVINEVVNEDNIPKLISSKLSKNFDLDLKYSAYGAGIKINISDDIINLVRLSEGDFLFWMYATDYLNKVSMINNSVLNIKTVRHGIFEQLRGIGKEVITYQGIPSNSNEVIEIISKLGM